MSLSVDARTLRDLLANPAAAEILSAVTGCPLVVVDITDRSAGLELAGLDAPASSSQPSPAGSSRRKTPGLRCPSCASG